MTYSELIDQHIGLSLRKQLALADFLGKHSWQLDMTKGTVDFGKAGFFGKRRIYPVQVLGTESEAAGTWLWAWANAASGIPENLLKAVTQVKSFGQSQGISELATRELDSSACPGHTLAMIWCGIADADCYYRGPYAGGAAFFLIFDSPLKEAGPTPTTRVANVLMQVISEYSVNHRAMTEAYLEAEGFALKPAGSGLSATADDGRALRVRFDDQGRIAGINTTVSGG